MLPDHEAPAPVPQPSAISTTSRKTLCVSVGALVVSLPFMDLEVFQILGKSIVLPYVVLIPVALALVLERQALQTHLRADTPLPFLVAWVIIAACSAGVAFLRSQDAGVLAANVTQVVNIAYMVVHYVVIGAALRMHSNRDFSRVRDIFVWTACAGAALSVYQVGSVVFGWPYAEWLRTSNLYYKANTLNWIGGGSWIAWPRAFGSAPEPTFWAGYLAIGLCFALVRLVETFRVRFAVEAGAIVVGLLLTFSRAAAPPVAAAIIVWALARSPRRQWIVPAIVGATLWISVWPAFLDQHRLAIASDLSAIERVSAQVTGVRMVTDYPLLGVGPGSVASMIDPYLSTIEGNAGIGFSRLYSFVLIVIVTTGVIGTILFALFLLELGRRQYFAVTGRVPGELRTLALSSLVAYAFILIYWIGSPAYNMSFLWFALAFGSAVNARPLSNEDEWPVSV